MSTRPAFHITGEFGWINDPNGLVKFKDEFHVFFQYYPRDVHWGPMHWGHMKSRDLFNWERLPVALCPDEQDDGCFSGSAIVWKDTLWLMYTSYKENGGGKNVRQLQALASSTDGVHFVKHGIVIGEKDLPSDYSPCDFRDPKIFVDGGTFYCLVAARKKKGRGRILLFSSEDLFSWKFELDLFNRDCGGSMIECPDYNSALGLLTYSEQFQPAEGYRHLNVDSTFYRLGKLDCAAKKAVFGNSDIIDYGFDFYAPQTFQNLPIMIGWLGMWDRNTPYDKHGFSGMLTIPRKLAVNNGRLWQQPIYNGKKVTESNAQSFFDRAVCGVIEITVENITELSLKLRVGENTQTLITANAEQLVFDRSHSGEAIVGSERDEYSLAGVRIMPLDEIPAHNLTVVFDLFSVEVFADGRALSAVICPDLRADGIEFAVHADKCKYERYDCCKQSFAK